MRLILSLSSMLCLLPAVACLQLSTLAWAAPAPSFNCATATPPAEKAICSDRDLAEADATIAARLIEVRNAVDSYTGEALDKDQRYFIEVRDKLALAASPEERIKILLALLAGRVEFLNSIDTSTGDSLVGEWRNFMGDVIVEQISDGNLKASISTVEPVHGNWVCQAEGSGKPGRNILDFAVSDGEKDERISLARVGTQPMLGADFTRSGRMGMAASFCGLNGSVEGFYFKVRSER